MLTGYFNDNNRKILLLRHGELNTGGRKVYVGQADVPLSPAGVGRGHSWAKILQNLNLGKIISSDLKRCAETAYIIGAKLNLTVELNPAWREISFGDWDGRDFEEVRQAYPEMVARRRANFLVMRPPGGENFMDLQARVTKAFEALVTAESDGHILVVTHAGVMRTLLAYLMGLPPENIFHIFQDFACLNIIDTEDGRFRHVRALNLMH